MGTVGICLQLQVEDELGAIPITPLHMLVPTRFENGPSGLSKFRDHVCFLLEDAIAHLLMICAKNTAENSATRKICETIEFRTAYFWYFNKIEYRLKMILNSSKKSQIC